MPLQAIETRYGRDPLPTDDVSKGYGNRWEWLNTATGAKFSCLVNTLGSAVWKGNIMSGTLTSIIVLTQAAYDAIPVKDASTEYIIVG